jgi:hypothetical protein
MYGIYHPFEFTYKNDVAEDVIMKVPALDFILTGAGAVQIVNWNTGAVEDISVTATSWEINEKLYSGLKVTASIPTSGQYVVVVDSFYYSPIIEYSQCDILQFSTKNSCSNQYHDWDSEGAYIEILLPEAQYLTPVIETETLSIVTNNGEVAKSINQKIKNRIQYLGTTGFTLILNSLKINDLNYFNTGYGSKRIKNIEIESAEQLNGKYSIFTINFEFYDDIVQASSCCDYIDIDDIINPENPNGDDVNCTTFAVEISKSGDTLTATVTGAPTGGTLTYRWYKNGSLASTSATVDASIKGEYRVDVRKDNCRATAVFLIQDECEQFSLEVNKIENSIFGTVSNVPEGETVQYSVKFEGTEVATALPYEAEEDGIYYIEVTAGDCKKIKAISIVIQNEDCDFDIDITEASGVLTAVTDSTSPTYNWELDSGEGRVVVGNAATLQINGYGIYFLTITSGLCEKEKYFVKFNTNREINTILHRVSGTTFTVFGIDMTENTENIEVFVNGVKWEYVAVPSSTGQWGLNGSGQLIISAAHSLTNATIRITKS